MKGFLLLALAVLATAAPVQNDDDNCSVQWVTVYSDDATSASSPGTLPTVQPSKKKQEKVEGSGSSGTVDQNSPAGQNAASSSSASSPAGTASAAASSGSSSAASTSADLTNSNSSSTSPGSDGVNSANSIGEPGFPINGQHLSAPVADDAVPADAHVYTPPSKSFSGKAFAEWWDNIKNSNPSQKWMKITPGVYNMDDKDALTVGFSAGGFTLDLRGVTFLLSPDNPDKTSGQAIYINQSEDLTILGGTVWFDDGELFTQAKVTSIVPADGSLSTVTFEVQDGYPTAPWKNAGPRNQGVVDTSNSNHYTRPDVNFWFVQTYTFTGDRTFTTKVDSPAGIKEGQIIWTFTGQGMFTTIASEWNGNLHVKGFTSNAAVAQYGLAEKVTATFEDVWIVNPPARPGYAPRVNGPTLSFEHIGDFDFNADGEAAIIYQNCKWQYTGSMSDLQDRTNQNLPTS